jgi:hypothetical protein
MTTKERETTAKARMFMLAESARKAGKPLTSVMSQEEITELRQTTARELYESFVTGNCRCGESGELDTKHRDVITAIQTLVSETVSFHDMMPMPLADLVTRAIAMHAVHTESGPREAVANVLDADRLALVAVVAGFVNHMHETRAIPALAAPTEVPTGLYL